MTIYNDLIEELKNENLLDDRFLYSATALEEFENAKQTPLSGFQASVNDFYALSPAVDPAEQTSTPPLLEENKVSLVLEPPYSPYYSISSLRQTHNLLKHKAKRNPQKRGNVCKTCAVIVPFYHLHCGFCHQRVIGDLVFYSMIGFSVIIFTILALFIITSKNYR